MTINPSLSKPPLVFDLAGPAGAGKSTLAQALGQRDQAMRLGLCIRRRKRMPFLITDTLLLLPTCLDLYRTYRLFLWDEINQIIHLNTLHKLVRHEASKHYKSLVLDQGPVFKLSHLHAFGHELIKSAHFEEWWESALCQWAKTLHAVIWLDAPDPILARRIRTRNKSHRVKEVPNQEIFRFLAHYRASYDHVISKLTAHQGPMLLKFDTEQESLERIVDKVLSSVDDGNLRTVPAPETQS